jgi:dienelactone hydrolase
MGRRWVGAVTMAMLASLGVVSQASALDPAIEAKNFSKTGERAAIYSTPEYQAQLRTVGTQNQLNALAIEAADPERAFMTDLCWNGYDGCAGDVRLYDWQTAGHGIVQPVLWTARNGATISGHVWATKAGPAKRPGIVITNGSVQADEQMYWYAAQALAKAGYVVLTWDPQGQGQSDTRGEAPDENEGFPAQSDGRPFFDGTEDALDFFLSTPQHPYVPVTSCDSGTSHAAKQQRRVAAGLDAGSNPLAALVDPGRIGLAGHSYGAAGVSYVGQLDPRVDAIVAWDNLSQASPGTADGATFPPGEKGCPSHPEDRVDLTKNIAPGHGKPALGMSADYFLPPTPNTADPPTPEHCQQVAAAYDAGTPPSRDDGTNCKSLASLVYSRRGIDTGELVIRGGSHLDFSWIPNHAFGATLRGADMIAWYTTAWFDKYVKGDPTADRRLLTDRWRRDGQEAAVDPDHDANMFSFYHRSRLDVTAADGTKVTCEDLRAGCSALGADDYPGEYSYLALATSPDHADAGAGATPVTASGLPRACASRRTITVHPRRHRGARIRRVTAYFGARRVARSSSGHVRVRLVGLPRQTVKVRLVVEEVRRGGKVVRYVLRRAYRTCAT